ncbi:hypothetical protein [Synechococcus phage BUCT-ZZ01]|nr:hypothetical protein [Synechococcus phage BUCT-ZZ01]
MLKKNADDILKSLNDAIMFSYLHFYISGEYKKTFSGKEAEKCERAARVLADNWFHYDFTENDSLTKLIEITDQVDGNISDAFLEKQLCNLYVYAKAIHSALYYEKYNGVVKATKTLLKFDFHMSKEEIKALMKND